MNTMLVYSDTLATHHHHHHRRSAPHRPGGGGRPGEDGGARRVRQRLASAAHVRANGLTSADDFVRAYSEPYRKPDNIANAHPAAYLPTELPALAGAFT